METTVFRLIRIKVSFGSFFSAPDRLKDTNLKKSRQILVLIQRATVLHPSPTSFPPRFPGYQRGLKEEAKRRIRGENVFSPTCIATPSQVPYNPSVVARSAQYGKQTKRRL